MNTSTNVHLHDHGITAEVRDAANSGNPDTVWVAIDSPKGGSFAFFVDHVGDALAISVAFADLANRLNEQRLARPVKRGE